MNGKYYFDYIDVEMYDGTIEQYDFTMTVRNDKIYCVYVTKSGKEQYRRISLYDPTFGVVALELFEEIRKGKAK